MANIDRTITPPVSELPIRSFPKAQNGFLPGCNVPFECLSGFDAQPVSRISLFWPIGNADVDSCSTLSILKPMLTEGCEGYSGAEIAKTLEYNGAWFKIDSGRHNTIATLHLLNKTAPKVMPLLSRLLFTPTFPDEALARLKEKAIAAERIQQQQIKTLALRLGNDMVFGHDAPASRMPTPECLAEVCRDDLELCHKRLFKSICPTMFMAGDITDHILSLAGEIDFPVLQGCGYCQNIVAAPPLTVSATETAIKHDSLQTAVRMLIPAINSDHPDYYPLLVAVYALGGYFGSRLMSNIREQKGYTYGITASLLPSKEGAFISISCETDNRFAQKVLKEIEFEIERLANSSITLEELRTIRRSALSGIQSSLDSPFTALDNLIVGHAFGFDAAQSFINRQQAFIEASPESISLTTRKYLLNAPKAIALAGNPEK